VADKIMMNYTTCGSHIPAHTTSLPYTMYKYRSVPHIRPPFCNLSTSRKRGGGGGGDV